MNYIATVTPKTVRVHRDTCKTAARSYNARSLQVLTDEQLLAAKPGSCCKPKPEAVVEALVAETEAREEAARMDYLAEETEQEEAERSAEQATADGDHVVEEVEFESSGVPKHYWKVFCRAAANDFGHAVGAIPLTRANRVRMRGQADRVRRAVHALQMLWGEGLEQFTYWRKNDPEYLEVKASEPGVHWNRSLRKTDELNWLYAFVYGVTQHLKGGAVDSDSAAAQGYSWAKTNEL